MTLPPEVQRRLSEVAGLRVLPGAELRHHTRFRLGGPCWLLADAEAPQAFEAAYRILAGSQLRWTSIGRGTNLIVSDEGYSGAILRYSAHSLETDEDTVIVDAGAELNDLIDFANAHSLAGMEAMAGIPGWVGAAIYGNAGAYGQSINQRVESVRYFDGGSVGEWSNEECGFRYRHSRFKEDKRLQILSARLRFQRGEQAALEGKSAQIRATRDAKFPPAMACAGSIFKNYLWKELPEQARAAVPPDRIIEGKVPAGWFLEQIGAKGMQVGGIRVADYHANLIYNTGSGTTADLIALLTTLKTRARHEFNLSLEEEVQYVGFEDAS
ncbi:MAG: UDP-N-acetylmuramate dehydrogenase [Acidobacteria bacterium]|nr:UDP-N-acetylmuramate dehydrogenase [Acidobacteriota bacterium]